jgi:hypothetical protein
MPVTFSFLEERFNRCWRCTFGDSLRGPLQDGGEGEGVACWRPYHEVPAIAGPLDAGPTPRRCRDTAWPSDTSRVTFAMVGIVAPKILAEDFGSPDDG